MGWEVDTEISNLIQPYQEQLTEEEIEELKNLLNGVALTAERKEFVLGINGIAL